MSKECTACLIESFVPALAKPRKKGHATQPNRIPEGPLENESQLWWTLYSQALCISICLMGTTIRWSPPGGWVMAGAAPDLHCLYVSYEQ